MSENWVQCKHCDEISDVGGQRLDEKQCPNCLSNELEHFDDFCARCKENPATHWIEDTLVCLDCYADECDHIHSLLELRYEE